MQYIIKIHKRNMKNYNKCSVSLDDTVAESATVRFLLNLFRDYYWGYSQQKLMLVPQVYTVSGFSMLSADLF